MFRALLNKLRGEGGNKDVNKEGSRADASPGESNASGSGPLYALIDPVSMPEYMPTWAPHFADYDQVVGYSYLGHVFMRNTGAGDYAVLHPFRKAAKSYGEFADIAAFEEQILREPGFAGYVLRDEHVALVRKHVGPLGEGEVYIPTPYPFIGGDDAPGSYSKGKVWVFLEIVAQMQGLDE